MILLLPSVFLDLLLSPLVSNHGEGLSSLRSFEIRPTAEFESASGNQASARKSRIGRMNFKERNRKGIERSGIGVGDLSPSARDTALALSRQGLAGEQA